MARPARPERSTSARPSRQLSRFYRSINSDMVFGTHRCSSPATRFSSCLHFARASRASVQAVFRAQNETSIPHNCACLGGSAVLVDADSADAIAVGNAVRRRSDDSIIKRNARLQFDIAPQIASDGYGLEQYVVVQTDGSGAQAVSVEDQCAGVIQDIKTPQQIEVDVNHEPT